MQASLLDEFASIFDGQKYIHRRSNLGDQVAVRLFEDLYALNRSHKLKTRVATRERVVNTGNRRRGVKARRGDGTFGELVPGAAPIEVPEYDVGRGEIASVEIGVEVKVLAKAMIKQIDRVIGDLVKQVDHFRRGGSQPICVGVVGVNYADHCTSYEGDRSYKTDGRKYAHPVQEATEAEKRLVEQAKPKFDEFLVLRYLATNEPPYRFAWKDEQGTALDYGAVMARLSAAYERRF